MAMRYLDVTLTDLKREFQLACSKPQHLTPQPNASVAPLRTVVAGVPRVLEMFRRRLPAGCTPASPDRPPTGSQRQRASGPIESSASAETAGKARHPTGIRVFSEPQNKILIDNCNSRGVPRPVA